jgi:hypothetical protein
VRRSWRWPAEPALAATLLVAAPAAARAQEGDLPPVGFGTLRQDEIAVRITAGTIAVRALPLDERVIRLLATDAYRSLSELVRSRVGEISEAARAAGLDSAVIFLVNFFAVQPDAIFSPDQLYVSSQNSLFRPVGVVPLTPRWSEQRLAQRQQAAAIYLFEPRIVVLQPFTLFYADRSSEAWGGSLRLLDAERARVLSRAAQRPGP